MYAEVMIATNTFFNYLILSFANKIGWIENQKRYLLLAAFSAGVITVTVSNHLLTICLTFFLMIGIAFWKKRTQMVKAISLTLLVSLFAGGLLTAISPFYSKSGNTFMIVNFAIIAIGGLYLLTKNVLHIHIGQSDRELVFSSVLTLFGQSKEINLFIDSGNGCNEPLSNDPVHFVASEVLKGIIPPLLFEAITNWEFDKKTGLDNLPIEFTSKLRLIPITTIQQQKTWVIGLKFEEWIVQDQVLPRGYIVMTKMKDKFPHGAEGILHSSSYYHLNKRSVKS